MLSPIKNTKIYEKIIEQIKDLVRKGELKSGDRLPSERDLSEQLQVSRTSVREALRALEMLGLVESKQGEGNFINCNFEKSLLEPLSIVFMLTGSNADEILELRKIIEPQAAALAAKKITEQQLQEITEISNELNNSDDGEISAELDKKFHYKIMQASGNLLISNIMFSVSSLVESYIKNTKINITDKSSVKKYHEEIYSALQKHDPIAAADAMKEHFKFLDGYLNTNH